MLEIILRPRGDARFVVVVDENGDTDYWDIGYLDVVNGNRGLNTVDDLAVIIEEHDSHRRAIDEQHR